jgi:hypothetical protein
LKSIGKKANNEEKESWGKNKEFSEKKDEI